MATKWWYALAEGAARNRWDFVRREAVYGQDLHDLRDWDFGILSILSKHALQVRTMRWGMRYFASRSKWRGSLTVP